MKYLSILIYLIGLVACYSSPTDEVTTPPQTSTLAKDTLRQAPPPPKDSLHSIKLTFIGDIMGHEQQIMAAAGTKAHFRSKNMNDFDYEPCFRYIKPILEEADLAIGNLELTLSNKGRYKGYPMFRSPDRLAIDLKNAGLDFLTTCNNHSNDAYTYGIHHTIDILDSLKFHYTGTFKDTAGYKNSYPYIIDKKVDGTTFRMAFLNYTFSTNGIPTPKPAIVNRIDNKTILADIKKAKSLRPDVIIAMMHWGREYQLNEHKNEQKLTKLLWENGVDIVIGGHPHVIQPIKVDTLYNEDSSQQREVLVTYSLGNFISNQTRPNTDIGLLFELELIKNSNSYEVKFGKHDYIFVWRYVYNKATKDPFEYTHTIVPVSAFEENSDTLLFMPKKDRKAMLAVTNKMRKHLEKWNSTERKITLKNLGELKAINDTKKTKYKKKPKEKFSKVKKKDAEKSVKTSSK